MVKRSRLEQKIDILRAVESKPIRPTRLMGLANLSYSSQKPLLIALKKGGLIVQKHSRKAGGIQKGRDSLTKSSWISITNAGRFALADFDSLDKRLGD